MLTNFLIQRFIADFDQTKLPAVRMRYGNLSGRVGLVVNFLLFGIKLTLGLMSGAISIVADAIHNLADAGSSIVTLLGFRLAAKPADPEHPFCHGRIEYLAGLCIAAAIMLIGAELMKSSVEKLLAPEPMDADGSMMIILLCSIVLQLWLGRFNRHIGQTIHSAAIEAAAADSLNDCIATTVVVLSLGVYYFAGYDIDGAAGVLVALFILHSGWGAARDTIQPLLGQAPDPELVRSIEDMVLDQENICGIHDLIIHDYGPGRIFASLHAEIPSTMDIMEAHELMDGLEVKLQREFHMQVTVHMDPIVIDDPETDALRYMVEGILSELDAGLSMHDFRTTTTCNHGRNLIFDVVVPAGCKLTDKNIRRIIREKLTSVNAEYHAVIRLDRFYC